MSLSLLLGLLLTAITGQADCTIVYFSSPDCQPCKQFEPTLIQLRQQGWDIRSVNAPQQLELAKRYRIENLPTLVVLNGGQEVDRIVGAASQEQLQLRFTRALARGKTNGGVTIGSAVVAQRGHERSAEPNWPVVRGQSPSAAMSGFPMLTAGNLGGASSREQQHSNQATPSLQASESGGVSSASYQFQQTSLNMEQAIARAAAATVRIKVEEANTTAFGTGTIVDVHGSEALVLTCGHLFRDMKPGSQLTVDLFAGTPQEQNVVAQLIDFKAEKEDIGLLSLQLPVAIEPVELMPRGNALQIGQPAFSFGCDHGKDPTRRDTQIKNINRYVGAANIEIVGAPTVGRSGGGLFDAQGRLIGVCNAADEEDNEGIYAAADVVYLQLARLGMSHLFENQAPTPETAAASAVQLASSQIQIPSEANPERITPAQTVPSAPDVGGQYQAVGPSSEASNSAAATGVAQVICIVRDQAGNDRMVTIPSPSADLLQTIEAFAR